MDCVLYSEDFYSFAMMKIAIKRRATHRTKRVAASFDSHGRAAHASHSLALAWTSISSTGASFAASATQPST